MRRSATLVACVLAVATTTAAQPAARRPPAPAPIRPVVVPPLVGLTATGSHVPTRGFVDDVVTTDGGRLVVVITDGAELVEARVLGADGTAQATVPLGAVAPAVRRLYLRGDRLIVVADADEGAPVTAAVLGLDGKVVKQHAAATELFVRAVDGTDALIAVTRAPGKKGVVHKVTVLDLVTGKPVKKRGGQLTLGPDGRDGKLDFTPAYWLDDQTVAVGLKGGVWRKPADQRSPDTDAAYDLIAGRWLRDQPIADVVGHKRRLEVLRTAPAEPVFARVKEDLSAVEVWRDGVPAALALDQPFELYDPTSLGYAWRGDRLWIGLKVDPVNPPAVARKKADPEYLDLFEVDGARAVRRARLLAPRQKLRWGFAGDALWVMDRNVGFDRGSKSVRFFALTR